MAEQSVTFEQLVDWVEGKLDATDAALVAAAVAANPELQTTIDWLEQFSSVRQQVTLADPPSTVQRALMARFVERHQPTTATMQPSAQQAPEETTPGFFQRLLATLTFDSSTGLAPAGVRSATTPDERQYLYHTAIAEIALNVQQDSNLPQVTLWGQVFPLDDHLDPAGLTVQVLQDAKEMDVTTTDEYGEFSFSIPTGLYEIVLMSDSNEVSIERLEV
ncbi:MAG: hypothetical protein R2932_25785 [Caldilineaceae bacterium]